jgi:hypothetical protein
MDKTIFATATETEEAPQLLCSCGEPASPGYDDEMCLSCYADRLSKNSEERGFCDYPNCSRWRMVGYNQCFEHFNPGEKQKEKEKE